MTTTNKLVETITEGIQEKKGKNIVIADLSGIDGATRQEALYVLGRRVFGSGELGRHEKRRAFMLTERKLLSAQNEFPGEGLTFYYRAAMLGKLYRYDYNVGYDCLLDDGNSVSRKLKKSNEEMEVEEDAPCDR